MNWLKHSSDKRGDMEGSIYDGNSELNNIPVREKEACRSIDGMDKHEGLYKAPSTAFPRVRR
jgi:hypothetical protein